MRRAAVLGSPIQHSLSPTLHRAAYRQLGLPWSYDAVAVTEAELAGFLDGCGPEWAGLSLTMPLKRAVLALLTARSELVELTWVANTVVFGPGDARVGHNTDVAGIAAALRAAPTGPALVLGGGATAASALVALHTLGCPEATVCARRPQAGAEALSGLAGAIGLALTVRGWPAAGERLPDAEAAAITVCTAPSAAGADLIASLPHAPGALLDVSYAPWPPPLVTAWRAAGGVAVAGDQLLLHQAAAQVELMTGRAPDIEAMDRALQAELGVC